MWSNIQQLKKTSKPRLCLSTTVFDAKQANSGKIATFWGYSSLHPRAQASLNVGDRDFDCQNLHSMLKNLYAGCLGISLAISAQFIIEMCDAAKNRERFILGVQDRLRSLMLTPPKSSSPVLVMISSTSMPICNYFYPRQAKSDKITFFVECPLFPLFVDIL